MSSICLIRVPNYLLYDEKLQTPLGILYIASYLREHGGDVAICDLAGVSPSEWADKIPAGHKFYGISMTTPDVPIANAIGKLIKKLYPKSTLVCGGAHPSAMPKQIIDEGIFDIVCVGEGEQTVLELVQGLPLEKINGIYWSKSYRRLRNLFRKERWLELTPPREYWNNIDSLPFPAWDMIPDLISYNLVEKGVPATCITGSRGCPYKCAFCATRDVYGRSYRVRSAENILEEITILHDKYGVKEVRLVDELTLLNREHFIAICESLGKMGMKWRTHSRADLICKNKDLLKLAKDSGITELAVGVENPDDGILKLVNKRVTSEQCADAITEIKKAGIQSKAYFIVGLPGESWWTIQNMIDWIREVKPDKCTLSSFVPYPNCDIYSNPEKYDYKFVRKDEWSLAWILGLENSQSPFMGETAYLKNEDLIKARQKLFDFMIDEGYKDPPPEDFKYNLELYRSAI